MSPYGELGRLKKPKKRKRPKKSATVKYVSVTYGDGVLYVCDSHGVISAFDAEGTVSALVTKPDGTFRWTRLK